MTENQDASDVLHFCDAKFKYSNCFLRKLSTSNQEFWNIFKMEETVIDLSIQFESDIWNWNALRFWTTLSRQSIQLYMREEIRREKKINGSRNQMIQHPWFLAIDDVQPTTNREHQTADGIRRRFFDMKKSMKCTHKKKKLNQIIHECKWHRVDSVIVRAVHCSKNLGYVLTID